jgi:hypothetical protein
MQIGHFSGHFPVKIQKFINDTCIPVVAECNIDLMNTHAILDIKYYASDLQQLYNNVIFCYVFLKMWWGSRIYRSSKGVAGPVRGERVCQ